MSDISPDVFGTAGFQRKLPGLERLKKTAEQRRDRRHVRDRSDRIASITTFS